MHTGILEDASLGQAKQESWPEDLWTFLLGKGREAGQA